MRRAFNTLQADRFITRPNDWNKLTPVLNDVIMIHYETMHHSLRSLCLRTSEVCSKQCRGCANFDAGAVFDES